jgi:transcriptional regulator with XRE-family HTH domain
MNKSRAYSRYSLDAAILFGKQIKLGRKQRHWTEAELAERAGVSISTVKRIEKGDMKCALGLFFEAATLVGINLFYSDGINLATQTSNINDKIALLPKTIHNARTEVDDDF